MRSSEGCRGRRFALAVGICALLATLTACDATPTAPAVQPTRLPAPSAPTAEMRTAEPACPLAGPGAAPARLAELAALQRSVETGPLFAALTARGAVRCTARVDGGELRLAYVFGGVAVPAAMLQVTRDTAIEYTDIEAHAAADSLPDMLALLARGERAAFGAAGCGIDWQTVETRPAAQPPGGRVKVYRGATCNCQGRVIEDAGGAIVGYGLRSAC